MILYIQYEADDAAVKEIDSYIDFIAERIKVDEDSNEWKPDKHLLFKNTWLVNVWKSLVVDSANPKEDIYAHLRKIVIGGRGRFIMMEIPELKSEFNRMIDSWISTNAIEWLSEHFLDVEDDNPELAKAQKAVDDFYNNCIESNPMAGLLAED